MRHKPPKFTKHDLSKFKLAMSDKELTAEEVLRKEMSDTRLAIFGLGSPLGKAVLIAMKQYASIKCREQREVIAKQIFDTYNFDGGGLSHVNKRVNQDILNAPEPKHDRP